MLESCYEIWLFYRIDRSWTQSVCGKYRTPRTKEYEFPYYNLDRGASAAHGCSRMKTLLSSLKVPRESADLVGLR